MRDVSINASPALIEEDMPPRDHACYGSDYSRKSHGNQIALTDRFIPCKRAENAAFASFCMVDNVTCPMWKSYNSENEMENMPTATPSFEYQRKIACHLLDTDENGKRKILAFKNKATPQWDASSNAISFLHSKNAASSMPLQAPPRRLPKSPCRVLDAPELSDDYYLNLLDWSRENVVAVGLGGTVFLWNADSAEVTELMHVENPEDYICSVAWTKDGMHLAVGISSGEIGLWDCSTCRKLRGMRGHAARVSALSWSNLDCLASGSRDTNVVQHDVRIREHTIQALRGHQLEVCGLKWSRSGQLASGGNDNLLHIWDSRSSSSDCQYLHRFDQHQAAVKALAWCPFQHNLLASGGGTSDRTIKFWNTQTGALLSSVDTLSQVCALQWNRHHRELLSSHGYSQNHLCLWKYPSMVKLTELSGHTSRVLHLAQSPKGDTVVSAAGDETMRFWNIFGSDEDLSFPKSRKDDTAVPLVSARAIHLR